MIRLTQKHGHAVHYCAYSNGFSQSVCSVRAPYFIISNKKKQFTISPGRYNHALHQICTDELLIRKWFQFAVCANPAFIIILFHIYMFFHFGKKRTYCEQRWVAWVPIYFIIDSCECIYNTFTLIKTSVFGMKGDNNNKNAAIAFTVRIF